MIDNFYSSPENIIYNVIKSGFTHAYKPLDGESYTSVGRDRWFRSNGLYKPTKVRKKFEKIIGNSINIKFWDDGVFWNGRFLCKLEGSSVSYHSHDNEIKNKRDGNDVGKDGWSAIIFLNKKAPIDKGYEVVKPVEPIKYATLNDKESIFLENDNWVNDISIGNVFNRCILSRGDMYHSGTSGFGDKFSNCRMIQTFFFKESELQ